MKYLIILVFAFLVASCGGMSPNIPSWWPDYPFEPNSSVVNALDRGVNYHFPVPLGVLNLSGNSNVEDALELWNNALPEDVFFEDSIAPIVIIEEITEFPNIPGELEIGGSASVEISSVHGLRSCKIFLLPDSNIITALHELGHCLSLGHTSNPSDIMGSPNAGNKITYDTIQLLLSFLEYGG